VKILDLYKLAEKEKQQALKKYYKMVYKRCTLFLTIVIIYSAQDKVQADYDLLQNRQTSSNKKSTSTMKQFSRLSFYAISH
jgi:hypothetical protein